VATRITLTGVSTITDHFLVAPKTYIYFCPFLMCDSVLEKADFKLYQPDVLDFWEKAEKLVKVEAKNATFHLMLWT
jgi:hypothetical protein